MAHINDFVYIIVGAIVSLVSWKVDYSKLIIFFYIGILFMLIGIGKLVYKAAKKPRTQKIHHQPHQQHPVKYCHNCGNASRQNDRFCSRCGVRL